MKKTLEDIYLISILVIFNLILVDVDVLGLELKTAFLLLVTLIVIYIHTIKKPKISFSRVPVDIAVCMAGACGLIVLICKLIAEPLEINGVVTVLTLSLVYYFLRVREEAVSKDAILIFSIANAVISLALLWHYLVDTEFVFPVALLWKEDTILSWLVLAITINVIGYCIYEGKQVWYGINAFIGFFLLFLQNNLIATGIVGLLFLVLPLEYKPAKRLIKHDMQLFFAYTFLYCNMSLITGYTGLIKAELTYDLELSVYMELLLAVFGVFFFHYWDKYTTEEDDDRKLLPELREFFQKTLLVAGILLAVFGLAVVRGSTAILPEVLGKLVEQGKAGIVAQTGSFETVAQRYGMLGVAFTLFLYYTILRSLVMRKRTKLSRHQKIFRVVTRMFVIQGLFLTQSIVTLPVYMVFIVAYLRDNGTFEKKERGEKTYEVDYSDSVL